MGREVFACKHSFHTRTFAEPRKSSTELDSESSGLKTCRSAKCFVGYPTGTRITLPLFNGVGISGISWNTILRFAKNGPTAAIGTIVSSSFGTCFNRRKFERKNHGGWDSLRTIVRTVRTCFAKTKRITVSSSLVRRQTFRITGRHNTVPFKKEMAMNLICGKEYRVGVVMRRPETVTDPFALRHIVECSIVYCGGSSVDKEGHHVCGGVWADTRLDHRIRKSYFRLDIAWIVDPKDPPCGNQRWHDEQIRWAAIHYGREWRRALLESADVSF